MKNKVNKKTLIFIIITSVFSLVLFGLLLNYQYKTYTINYNNKINSEEWLYEKYERIIRSVI